MTNFDLKKAMLDPGSVFASPEDLLEEPGLTNEQKIELLKRWKYGAQELLDAASEGMEGNRETDLVRRVSLALESLEQDG